jgi:hypothetical protein
MRVLLATLLTIFVIISVDAGAGQSKPNSGLKISLKDASIAVSGTGEDSLGAAKPYVLKFSTDSIKRF